MITAVFQAALAIHRNFGSGFTDAFYRRALDRSLRRVREPALVRIVRGLSWKEVCRMLALLKATGIHRGLLLDFSSPRLHVRRFEVPYARHRLHAPVPPLRRFA